MSTKKNNREFNRTLYFEAIITFVIAIIIVAIVINAFIFGFNIFFNSNDLNNDKTNSNQINEQLAKVQAEIDKQSYTVEEVVATLVPASLDGYRISSYQIYDNEMKIISDNQQIDAGSYLYPLHVEDETLMLFIKNDNTLISLTWYFMLMIFVSIAVFILAIFFQAKKVVSYIRRVIAGVDLIAAGSLNYQIPVTGDNELTDLAVAINKMAFELDTRQKETHELEKRQRQLVTNVSHDLKTPLTSINGYLDIIYQLIDGEVDESILQYLASAQSKALQLQELILKLFEYSKIINSDVEVYLCQLDLGLFVQQYLDTVENEVVVNKEQKKYLVQIDPNLFSRVLDNLFSNIDKYGIEHEMVIIDFSEDKDYYYLSIKNKTVYNLQGKTEKMFLRTYVEEASRTSQSSGIGLSIVKESLALMNATIRSEFQKPYIAMIMKFKKLVEN